VHEPGLVAGEDRDALAGFQPSSPPGVGEPVRALIEFPEGEAAELVDQSGAAARTDRRGLQPPADQSVALERKHDLGHAMGELGSDQPAAHTQGDEVRLVAEALGDAGAAGENRLEVKLYHALTLPACGSFAAIAC